MSQSKLIGRAKGLEQCQTVLELNFLQLKVSPKENGCFAAPITQIKAIFDFTRKHILKVSSLAIYYKTIRI